MKTISAEFDERTTYRDDAYPIISSRSSRPATDHRWRLALPMMYIDLYCERVGPEMLAEPFNAFSNGAFFVTAWLLWRRMRQHDAWSSGALPLITLIVAIGIGSSLFHTYAQGWAQGTRRTSDFAVSTRVHLVIFASRHPLALHYVHGTCRNISFCRGALRKAVSTFAHRIDCDLRARVRGTCCCWGFFTSGRDSPRHGC